MAASPFDGSDRWPAIGTLPRHAGTRLTLIKKQNDVVRPRPALASSVTRSGDNQLGGLRAFAVHFAAFAVSWDTSMIQMGYLDATITSALLRDV